MKNISDHQTNEKKYSKVERTLYEKSNKQSHIFKFHQIV